MINWARIKLDLGEHKKALKLFSKALIIAEDFENPHLKARNLINKRIFYERHNLEEEEKISFENLSKSLSYFEKMGKEKRPLELFSIYMSVSNYYTELNTDSVYHYLHKIQPVLQYAKNPIIYAWYYVVISS